jgi:hypothetical protein
MLGQLYGVLEAVESVMPMLRLTMVMVMEVTEEATDSRTTPYLAILSFLDLDLDITQEELSAAASDQLNQDGDITTMPFLDTPISHDLAPDIIQEVFSAVKLFPVTVNPRLTIPRCSKRNCVKAKLCVQKYMFTIL